MKPKAYVSDRKKEEVKRIKTLLKKYPCFGIIDLTSLPSATLQSVRHKIKHNDVVILTSKKSLLIRAIEDLKSEIKGIEHLLPYIDKAIPALILTTINPFKLASIVNKNKTAAAAKPGQISPKEIIIPAGPTKFPPGPVIGELGAVGIKTAIMEGKINIKDDVHFVKEGEVIDKKKSEVLAKLGIEPMEIGMYISALYEKGTVYGHDVLSVSEETYLTMIKEAYQNSLNLAVFTNYMTADTMKIMIRKAYSQTKAIASKTSLEFSEDRIKPEKGFVGYDEESAEKAASLLKELQDQKMRENRT